MNKKIDERPVFPFTSIVGQEEICEMKFKLLRNSLKRINHFKIAEEKNIVKT